MPKAVPASRTRRASRSIEAELAVDSEFEQPVQPQSMTSALAPT
jgi:hypothetical protein